MLADAQRVETFADRADPKTLDQVRRRAQHKGAQHVGDFFQLAVEAIERARRRAG